MTRLQLRVRAGIALALCPDMATSYDRTDRLLPLSWDELSGLFDGASLRPLRALWARQDVMALVLFENQQPESASYLNRSALAVGPGCTYASVGEVAHGYLHEADERQDAVAYCAKFEANPDYRNSVEPS